MFVSQILCEIERFRQNFLPAGYCEDEPFQVSMNMCKFQYVCASFNMYVQHVPVNKLILNYTVFLSAKWLGHVNSGQHLKCQHDDKNGSLSI